VAAVRTGHVVVASEVEADPNGDGFLTYIKVDKTGHAAPAVEFLGLEFEAAEEEHAPVSVESEAGLGHCGQFTNA
jgi:hypothetical protein